MEKERKCSDTVTVNIWGSVWEWRCVIEVLKKEESTYTVGFMSSHTPSVMHHPNNIKVRWYKIWLINKEPFLLCL